MDEGRTLLPFDGMVFQRSARPTPSQLGHGRFSANSARPDVAADSTRSSARLVHHRDQADTVAVAQW
jgi:hypothetical protein